MELTIEIPERVVERAAALGVPVTTLVSQALDQIVEAHGNSEPGSIIDLLAMPDGSDPDFEPPRLRGPLYRPADLS